MTIVTTVRERTAVGNGTINLTINGSAPKGSNGEVKQKSVLPDLCRNAGPS